MRPRKKVFYICLALVALAVSGCSSGGGTGRGPGLTSISGEVTYHDLMGLPAAPEGLIVGVANINTWDTEVDGSTGGYRIEEIPEGMYTVVVKEARGLPADATFWMEPPQGVRVDLKARIPMMGVNLTVITMPGVPEL